MNRRSSQAGRERHRSDPADDAGRSAVLPARRDQALGRRHQGVGHRTGMKRESATRNPERTLRSRVFALPAQRPDDCDTVSSMRCLPATMWASNASAALRRGHCTRRRPCADALPGPLHLRIRVHALVQIKAQLVLDAGVDFKQPRVLGGVHHQVVKRAVQGVCTWRRPVRRAPCACYPSSRPASTLQCSQTRCRQPARDAGQASAHVVQIERFLQSDLAYLGAPVRHDMHQARTLEQPQRLASRIAAHPELRRQCLLVDTLARLQGSVANHAAHLQTNLVQPRADRFRPREGWSLYVERWSSYVFGMPLIGEVYTVQAECWHFTPTCRKVA
jgi:hypothetical protein